MGAVWRFLCDESGPTAVEYAVMLALIIAACLAGIQLLVENTASSFTNSGTRIGNAISGSS